MRICIFMGVYKDQNLAKYRLQELNRLYSEGEIDIVVISDGVVDEDFAEFCKGIHSLHYEVSDRRKLSEEFGGAWVERLLKRCIELSDFDILVKIDPDTKLLRRFRYFPDAGYFGNRRRSPNSNKDNYLQGGCKGFSRNMAERILESNFLNDDKYKNNWAYCYQRFSKTYIRPGEEPENTLLIVEDAVVWDVVERLGEEAAEWGEVNCHTPTCHTPTFVPSDLFNGDYAAVHPVYGE